MEYFNLHLMKLRSYIDDYKHVYFYKDLHVLHLIRIIVKDRRWIPK